MTAPQPLTPAEVAAIEARAEAATPGPWIHSSGTSDGHQRADWINTPRYSACTELDEADAVFAAAAREDVPALLRHARAVEERARAAEAERDALLTACAAIAGDEADDELRGFDMGGLWSWLRKARQTARAALAARRTR